MKNFFDINICSTEAALLYLLPALINFGIFIYVYFFLTKNKTNLIFGTFVLLIGLWQVSEGFLRASQSAEAAFIWFRISMLSLFFVVPFGMFFTLKFLRCNKRITANLLLFSQFIPAAIFSFFILAKAGRYHVIKSEKWYWIVNPEPSMLNLTIYCWLALSSLFVLGILWFTYFNSATNAIKRKQALLLSIGFSLPIIIGIITEVIFPLFLGLDDIPLASSFFTIFSITSFIAMKNYKFLDFSPKHQWDSIVEAMNEGLIIVNNKEEIMYANKTFCEQLGYTFEEIKGKIASKLFFAEESQIKQMPEIVQSRKKFESSQYEVHLKAKNGDSVWALISGSPYWDSNKKVIGSIGIQTIITDRKRTEAKLIKSNRIYSILSHINQLIVHSDNECALYKEACRIITDQGKFGFAWIGMINEEEKKINLVAESNAVSSDLEYFTNFNYDAEEPISIVINSGTYFVINDFKTQTAQSKNKQFSENREFLSAIYLPIRKLGDIVGTLSIFSSEINFFDKEEIALLEEISGDISFALDVFEKESERKKYKAKLKHSKARLKEAQAISHVGSWELNLANNISVWSDETCRIFGVSTKENRQPYESWLKYIHPEDLGFVAEKIKEFNALVCDSAFYFRIIRPDGEERYVYLKTQFDFDREGKPVGLHGVLQDVTEIKIAEQQKEFHKNNLAALINNTNDMMWSMDRNKKLITSNSAFDNMVKTMAGKTETDEDVADGGFKDELLEKWNRYYERAFTGESFKIVEHSMSTEELWSEISFYPIRKGDEVIGTACFSRNITEIKKAENEIITLNEDLEEKVMLRTVELAKLNVMLETEADMLSRASKIIEQKNKDVTDSLNYAKVIQNATINKKAILIKHFPNSFILNMPLYIVSGDFVRVDEKEGNVLVALADCTGHGIPGALMSMIGNSFFNDVIHYKHKISPSVVLRSLDSDFKYLTNEALEMHDGMDVGFCNIDINKMELNFAGAHRPLYLIRNNVLTEVKGDNLSIGGHSFERKKYTNNIIQLQKEDALYMFSDGYTDQFGGEKGKKFSSRRLKETLLSIQHLSMREQNETLKQIINNWKGKLEQVDDICVVGIKI